MAQLSWQTIAWGAIAVATVMALLVLILWQRLWRVAESETLCTALLNTMPNVVIRMKRDGTCVNVRAGVGSVLEQMATSLIDRHISDFLSDEIVEQQLACVERAIATNEIQTYDFSLTINGNSCWQEGRIVALNQDEVLIALRDITAYRQAIEHSQRQTNQCEAILAAIPDLMFQLRSDGVYLGYVKANQITDLLPPNFDPVGKHVTEYLPPEHAQRNLYYLQRALETKKVQMYEQQVDLGDRIQWEEVRVVANGDNKVLFIVRDISPYRHSEAERDRTAKQLQQQINRLLLLEQVTHEIRSHLDRQHIVTAAGIQIGRAFGVNRCLIHSYTSVPAPAIHLVAEYGETGYDPIQVIDIPVCGNAHVKAILADDRAIVSDNVYADPLLENMRDVCEQLQLKSMLAIRTSYYNQPNGVIGLHQCDRQRCWTHDEVALLEAVAAQVGIALYHARLLEQEQHQREELQVKSRELEQVSREAQAANRAKSAFLANMSHELRTPLNAILGFAQVMQLDQALPPDSQEYTNIILQSGDHLLKLINTVLDMSKIESGAVPFQAQEFNLLMLFQQIELMFQQQTAQKGLHFTTNFADNVPAAVVTDEDKLRQVLINLIGNAIKFTQEGAVRVRVAIQSSQTMDDPSLPEWAIAKLQVESASDLDSDLDAILDTPPDTTLDTTIQAKTVAASTAQATPWATLRSLETVVDTPYSFEYLSVEVEDTGCGIPSQELDRVFEAFVQTEVGQMSSNGTGLGLTLSKKFIELMGGTLRVHSQIGVGSTFQFHIPILGNTQMPRQLSAKTLSSAAPSPSFPKEELRAMSPEWIERLYAAAIRCDSVEAEALLEEITPENTHLATALHHLLYAFRFDQLAEILESVAPRLSAAERGRDRSLEKLAHRASDG